MTPLSFGWHPGSQLELNAYIERLFQRNFDVMLKMDVCQCATCAARDLQFPAASTYSALDAIYVRPSSDVYSVLYNFVQHAALGAGGRYRRTDWRLSLNRATFKQDLNRLLCSLAAFEMKPCKVDEHREFWKERERKWEHVTIALSLTSAVLDRTGG